MIKSDTQMLTPYGTHVVKFHILDLDQERIALPYMKDPSQKVSFWQILKDLIGKDLTKVSMPVYFNEPLTLT